MGRLSDRGSTPLSSTITVSENSSYVFSWGFRLFWRDLAGVLGFAGRRLIGGKKIAGISPRQLMAAIKFVAPTMFMARFRLYAVQQRAASAVVFSIPRSRK